jgi:hypothetical protein
MFIICMKGFTPSPSGDDRLQEKEVQSERNSVQDDRNIIQSPVIPSMNRGIRGSYRKDSCETSSECSDEGEEGGAGNFIF